MMPPWQQPHPGFATNGGGLMVNPMMPYGYNPAPGMHYNAAMPHGPSMNPYPSYPYFVPPVGPAANERYSTPVQEISMPQDDRLQQMFEQFKVAIGKMHFLISC
jgi:hypothetical protein